jgi:predicted phage tail protein
MGKDGGKASSDSILTDSSVKALDLLCEGQIKGLVAGAKSIYLNKVPIQSADGLYNFQPQGGINYSQISGGSSVPGLFSFGVAPGSNTQSYIPGFDAVQSEIAVGQEVKVLTGPVTIGINTPDLDALIVTLAFGQLIRTDGDGNPQKAGVSYAIYMKVDNGLFIEQHNIYLLEKSSSGFELQRTMVIPQGATSIQLRVTRLSADVTDGKQSDVAIWKSYTEVMYDKYNYPNTAYVALELNSKVLKGSLSERKYDTYCQEIRIPSNATVNADGSLIYAGSWDGTFSAPKWCACPAWCLYDLLENTRYGADIPAEVLAKTKWDYYVASQWCNEQVSNGQGGLEPRYLLNVSIESKTKAYQLIAQLAGVFGGIFYLVGGGLSLSVDRQLAPVAIFTTENAKFNYQNSALRNRFTVALVKWRNPVLLGEYDIEPVEDLIGKNLYGNRETTIEAFGCTSRSQARRFGLWYLLSIRLQANTLLITSNISAARLRPGEIVEVVDRNKRPFLMGRFTDTSAAMLTLDQEVVLSNSQTWEIKYLLPNGQPEKRAIVPTNGVATEKVSLTPIATNAPVVTSVWVIQSTNDPKPPQFQVLATTPKEGDSEKWEITTVSYEPTKWNQINSSLIVSNPPPTTIPTVASKPRDIKAYTSFVTSNSSMSGLSERLIIKWEYPTLPSGIADPYTQSYTAGYRIDTASSFTNISTSNRDIEVDNLAPGFYWVRVLAVNNLGSQSLDISPTDPIPVGLVINSSTQWSTVNSAVFLSAGMV